MALWAKLWACLLFGLLVLGNATQVRTRILLPQLGSDVLLFIQAGIIAAFLGAWWYTRRGQRSERALRAIEIAGTLLPVLIVTSALWFAPVYLRPELLVLIAVAHGNIARAVIIPSGARRTLILTAAVHLYVVVGTYAYYARAAVPGLPSPWLYATVVFAWSAITVTIATVASQTIFGLRQRVREITQLGQYRLEEKLGEGGMGVVYRASHVMLRRPTAVKLLLPGKSSMHDLMRFEREVQLTSILTHPNTVAIYDYGRTPDGVFYYAMEYLDGVDLQELVEEGGAQPPGAVVHLLEQVCGALEEAHGVGLIHRDIKPANVILCERGGGPAVAKVVDFGLVKNIDAPTDDPTLSVVDAILGTPLYLSPEAITRPAVADHRSDLYALGAVAYFLLTGSELFRAGSVVEVCGHHLHTVPEAPSRRLGTPLPEDLERLVLACLEKDPARRPQSAEALGTALRALPLFAEWTRSNARDWWSGVRKVHPARRRRTSAQVAGASRTLAVNWAARGQGDSVRRRAG